MTRNRVRDRNSVIGRLIALCAAVTLLTPAAHLAAQKAESENDRAVKEKPTPGGTVKDKAPDNSRPITSQTHPNNPELWNVDAMMEDAVKQIARHYNLTREQEDFTRLLLIKRTRNFLSQHEMEVRELLKESIDLRLGKRAGGADAFRSWAERAAPVYEAAKTAILDGNQEWRVTLNDEQKKIHDNDMRLMQANFDQVARTLENWKQGSGASTFAGTRRTQKELERSQVGGSDRITRVLIEDNWINYVKRFIQVYKLDEKQSIAAQEKIHKEMHGKATRYREKKKEEFARIESALRSPAGNVSATEQVRRRTELEAPIREFFVEMNERLLQLTDSNQMANVDPEAKRQLENLYQTLAGSALSSTGTSGKAVPVGTADSPKTPPAAEKPAPAAPSSKPAEVKEKSE